jgi:hypothetical protein
MGDLPFDPFVAGDTFATVTPERRREPKKEAHPAWEILYAMQRDHATLGGRIMAMRQWLASQDLPDPSTVRCPRCGIVRPGARSLAEHMYVSHDGDLPEHWEEPSLLRDSDA